MFNFFSKTVESSGLMRGMIDFHSHILPGVDDGIRSIEESIATLDYYESLGVDKVILTPHVMEELHNNTPEFLREKFEKFSALYKGKIQLSLGGEYLLDSQFINHLKSNDLLTLWDNYLLVETSFMSSSINLFNMIEQITSSGYFVVLAHPERYTYMSIKDYDKLIEMGVIFQLNLPSILGRYGKSIQARAQILLKSSYYTLIGSDIHNLEYVSNEFKSRKIQPKQIKLLEEVKALSILKMIQSI